MINPCSFLWKKKKSDIKMHSGPVRDDCAFAAAIGFQILERLSVFIPLGSAFFFLLRQNKGKWLTFERKRARMKKNQHAVRENPSNLGILHNAEMGCVQFSGCIEVNPQREAARKASWASLFVRFRIQGLPSGFKKQWLLLPTAQSSPVSEFLTS